MRTLKALATLIGSLIVIAVTTPLLALMRVDQRERNAADAANEYPYDDNDPGTDVDGYDPDDDHSDCGCYGNDYLDDEITEAELVAIENADAPDGLCPSDCECKADECAEQMREIGDAPDPALDGAS